MHKIKTILCSIFFIALCNTTIAQSELDDAFFEKQKPIGKAAAEILKKIKKSKNLQISDPKQALELATQATEKAKKLELKKLELIGHLQLSNIYNREKRYAKAIAQCSEAEALAHSTNDNELLAITYYQNATIYNNQAHPDEAFNYYKAALEQYQTLKNSKGMMHCNMEIGSIYITRSKLENAISHLILAKNFATTLTDGPSLNKINEKLQLCQTSLDNQKKTTEMQGKVSQMQGEVGLMNSALSLMKDSIQMTEREKKMLGIQMEMERNNQQQKLDLAQKQRELQELQIKEKEADKNVLVIILTMAGIVALLMVVQLRALTTARNKLQKTLTELKETQDQLVMSEKLASLGKVTAGIAHELKNPLNFINNFSLLNNDLHDELKSPISEEEKKAVIQLLQENTNKITEHGKRADGIITNMLRHLDNTKSPAADFDLDKMIEETLYYSLEQNKLRFPALSLQPQFELLYKGIVHKPKKDLTRAISNICDNALYALNAKMHNTPDFIPQLWIKTLDKNNYIAIIIKDNGNGIQASELKHIFEPFYTTKPANEGTGLGLSLAFDLIKSNGGNIIVESEPGIDCSFIIELPIK